MEKKQSVSDPWEFQGNKQLLSVKSECVKFSWEERGRNAIFPHVVKPISKKVDVVWGGVSCGL